MILEVFIAFVIICFVLIFIGFYTQIRVVALIGFTGLFLLGLVLQAGSVTAQNGATISPTSVTYNYSSLDDATTLWLGRWLAFAGALGFILTITSNKDSRINK